MKFYEVFERSQELYLKSENVFDQKYVLNDIQIEKNFLNCNNIYNIHNITVSTILDQINAALARIRRDTHTHTHTHTHTITHSHTLSHTLSHTHTHTHTHRQTQTHTHTITHSHTHTHTHTFYISLSNHMFCLHLMLWRFKMYLCNANKV